MAGFRTGFNGGFDRGAAFANRARGLYMGGYRGVSPRASFPGIDRFMGNPYARFGAAGAMGVMALGRMGRAGQQLRRGQYGSAMLNAGMSVGLGGAAYMMAFRQQAMQQMLYGAANRARMVGGGLRALRALF